ncbi:helix-turn-helix domain-containing protein [Eoetvoesiella caeni]
MPKIEMKRLAGVVGRAIAKRRVTCKLTQEQVAERLKIGVEAVSRIERGIVLPTVARLGEFAEVFRCDVADLVTETSSRPKDQARQIERLLSGLAHEDRALILEMVERLATRLG